jgi:hypothetical protein
MGVRDLHAERISRLEKKARWTEPGIEAVAIDLGFDSRKDLLPKVHFFILLKRIGLL